MARAPRSPLTLVLMALMGSSCTSGFDTTSAFDEEQYLCGPDSAATWQARIDACRVAFLADGSCLGVMSFRGDLQEVPVVVDAELVATQFDDIRRFDTSRSRDDLSIVGFAPYFAFELTMESIGGPVPDAATSRELMVGPTLDRAMRYEDAAFEAALRVSAGGDSADVNFLTGTFTVQVQQLNELGGRFALDGARAGNTIEGCFHAFDAAPGITPENP